MKSKIIAIALITVLSACGETEQAKPVETTDIVAKSQVKKEPTFTPIQDIKPIWNLSEIAGKTRNDVEKILGQPTSECEKGKYGTTCLYFKDGADWDINYINGKADWIGLTDKRIDNAYTSPVWLGYEHVPPTISAPARLGWTNLPGLLEYSAFITQDGQLTNIYIKTATP